MLAVNRVSFAVSQPRANVQCGQRQYNSTPQQSLNHDKVSFNGLLSFLFGTDKLVNNYFSKEVYQKIENYIKDNPRTYATGFMKQLLRLADHKNVSIDENLSENAHRVEKEKISEVIAIIEEVKKSPKLQEEPDFILLLDRCKNFLGKPYVSPKHIVF